MKKTEFQVKKEKYEAVEKNAFPTIRDDLTEAVEDRLEKNPGAGSFMKSD